MKCGRSSDHVVRQDAFYLDAAKPVKFAGQPKVDLILITDIHATTWIRTRTEKSRRMERRSWRAARVVKTVTTAKPIVNGETKTGENWTIEAIPAYKRLEGTGMGVRLLDWYPK